MVVWDYWIARAKRDYFCDICKKVIRKGEKRVVEGYESLVYVMINRNICLECFEKVKETEKLKELIEGKRWTKD